MDRWIGALLGVATASAAMGQCDPEWRAGLGLPGLDGSAWASTVWDPDGAGPASPLLVVSGTFSVAGDVAAKNIAAWDPATGEWSPLGAGLDDAVHCLGVLPGGRLVAGGQFQHSGATPVSRLASWDGESWEGVGGGVERPSDCSVNSLCVRPDGSLVVAGVFVTAGGVPALNVARWDGSVWYAMDGLNSYYLNSVANLPGGRLLAGGAIDRVNGLDASGVAVWGANGWGTVGEGLQSVVQQVGFLPGTRQPGERPSGLLLADAGDQLYFWDGAIWQQWGAPGSTQIDEFFVTSAHELVAGGWFKQSGGDWQYRVGVWRQGAWEILGGEFSYRATSFVELPGGDLIAAGTFELIDERPAQHVGRWAGDAWEPLSTGIDGNTRAIAVAPNDDTYIGGAFRELDGVWVDHVGLMRDGAWQSVGGGVDGIVNDIAVMSDSSVVVGGYFDFAGGVLSPGLSRWDGSQWAKIGGGPRMDVWKVLELSDGRLLVGGKDTNSSFPYCLNVWDGTSWDRGWASFTFNSDDTVYAAVELPNGDLVIGGRFDRVNGVNAGGIARWDGTQWHALAGGMGGVADPVVYALATGVGGELYAGGRFTTAGGTGVGNIARWDGQAWQPLGQGMNDYVRSLAVSAGGSLVAGGRFGLAGGLPADRIARWDGTAWHGFAGGIVGTVEEIAPLTGGDLLVGGNIVQFGEVVSWYLTEWDAGDAPWVAWQSGPASVGVDSTAMFEVAAGGAEPREYQWRKDGAPLADGATGHGSEILGATSASLTIAHARTEDAGGYDCEITNGCGAVRSSGASLVIVCEADLDGNGLVNTQDFVDFLDAWSGGDPRADFDRNGAIDTRDFLAYLALWVIGC